MESEVSFKNLDGVTTRLLGSKNPFAVLKYVSDQKPPEYWKQSCTKIAQTDCAVDLNSIVAALRLARSLSNRQSLSDEGVSSERSMQSASSDLDDEWIVAGLRTKSAGNSSSLVNSDDSFPLIRILIHPNVVDKFSSTKRISKEVKRCFKRIDYQKININRNKNSVYLYTEDKETFDYLTNKWPRDAFDYGIRKVRPRLERCLIMNFPHYDVDLDSSNIKRQLASQGVLWAERILKQKTFERSCWVQLRCSSNAAVERLEWAGLIINNQKFSVEKDLLFNHCYKCFKLGHKTEDCIQKHQLCGQCGKHGHHVECFEKPSCVNCKMEHHACSRKCPYLIENLRNVLCTACFERGHFAEWCPLNKSNSEPNEEAVYIQQQTVLAGKNQQLKQRSWSTSDSDLPETSSDQSRMSDTDRGSPVINTDCSLEQNQLKGSRNVGTVIHLLEFLISRVAAKTRQEQTILDLSSSSDQESDSEELKRPTRKQKKGFMNIGVVQKRGKRREKIPDEPSERFRIYVIILFPVVFLIIFLFLTLSA